MKGFPALFGIYNFLGTSYEFLELGASVFSFALSFVKIEQDFWRVHAQVSCCVANQYSEITGNFFQVSNQRSGSKG